MEVTKESILKIEVKGNNVALLKSILSKLEDSEKLIGFNNRVLNTDEFGLLVDINTKLK